MREIVLPEGWRNSKIGDVAEVKGGKRLPKGVDFSKDITLHPYLRVTDFHNSSIDKSNLKYIDDNAYNFISGYTIGKDDLYISIAGTIGLVGSIPGDLDGANLTENAAKICNIKYCDKYYLQYFLNSMIAKNQFIDKTVSSGQPKLALFRIRDCDLIVAPIAEQKQIATKLDELLAQVDTIKTRLDAIPPILKHFRQSVLAAAVSGKLTEEWCKKIQFIQSADDLVNKIKVERLVTWEKELKRIGRKRNYIKPVDGEMSSLPSIPKHWKWSPVDLVASKVVDGVHKKPKYQSNGIPFIMVKNLTAGKGISFKDLKYVSEEDHKVFVKRANPEKGDILITKDGTLGVVRQIHTDVEFSLFVSVALVKPVLKEMSDYIELAFNSPTMQSQMVGVGTGLQHIHLTDLRRDMIPIPPIEEQTEIVRRVEQLFTFVDQIEQRIKDAQARVNYLTQSILAKAFCGELTAEWRAQNPDLISGENSAEALLERIKTERAAQQTVKTNRNSLKKKNSNTHNKARA